MRPKKKSLSWAIFWKFFVIVFFYLSKILSRCSLGNNCTCLLPLFYIGNNLSCPRKFSIPENPSLPIPGPEILGQSNFLGHNFFFLSSTEWISGLDDIINQNQMAYLPDRLNKKRSFFGHFVGFFFSNFQKFFGNIIFFGAQTRALVYFPRFKWDTIFFTAQ